jgi:uncharacterized protein (DUF362 family)/NAD-dependent dihydropyrimidine dehydrogenase PreA subunit
MPSKILVLDGDYGRIAVVVEKVLEAFPLPWENRRVLIKPNMLGPNPPEKGITSHPALIRALVRSLKKRGAQCFVGDNPGLTGYAANEHCARASGLHDGAEGSYVNFAKETLQITRPSRFLEKLVISKAVLEADWVINVPKFKTHFQTRITGAVKNMFGIVVGAEKARVHLSAPKPRDFAEALVDIYQLRIPDLTIMDAVVGMEGNGPSGRDLRPIGKILAGRNGVAVDGLMAAMMGIRAQEVDMLAIAHQRGLGEVDVRNMEIEGSWAPIAGFKMPLPFTSRGWMGTLLNKFVYRPFVKPRLWVNPKLCNRCGVCVAHCPAQAMSMEETPFMDPAKCIACYCCLELCSSQAIEVTGWMKRLGTGKNKAGR